MSEESSRPEPLAARLVRVDRVLSAPARLVFLAHSAPEHLKRWYAPPGYPLSLCELDFREGGQLRMAMSDPEGVQGPPLVGEYLEIVPDERLVHTLGFDDPEEGQMTVSVFLIEEGGRTRLRVETVFESVAMKQEYVSMGYIDGQCAGLDQLGALVKGWAST